VLDPQMSRTVELGAPRHPTVDHEGENEMGIADKFSNKAEELSGRAKEAAGAATGDEDLKNEGKADQASSAVKKAVENVKDKTNEIVDKITGH
jgi:uncharacterized protein YjbJ (UPF0337 family)